MMIFPCICRVFSLWYLGYFNSIAVTPVDPEGKPANMIGRFGNSCLSNINTGQFVIVVLIEIKRKEVYTQRSCWRSRKTHLNGLPRTTRESCFCQHSPNIILQLLVFFRFHPAVKVINNLLHLTEIDSVLSNLSSDLTHLKYVPQQAMVVICTVPRLSTEFILWPCCTFLLAELNQSSEL